MIGLLMAWAVVGTEGIPIPYSPRMDDGITVVLLCCFFLSAYVLSRSRKCESSQSYAFEFLFFQLFSFVPEDVHLFQSHIMQVFAFLDGMCFQIIKAVDKFLVSVL